jgi:arylesterase/paraoxonase
MKKRWWFLLCWLLVTLALFVRLIIAGGMFARFDTHFAGKCAPVSGMPGAEDITFHPTRGYAYVSSDDRRAVKPVQGGIYRFDPESSRSTLLTGSFTAPFHPHGISLFVDAAGKETLYVINHPLPGVPLIEKFEVGEDGLLRHLRTLRDPTLVSINDLVAVDTERFYVTNDHHNPFGPMQLVEDVMQGLLGKSAAKGSVVYYDGKRFRSVVQGTGYANGINVSRDGKTLYLAEAMAKTLSVYARNERSGALTLRRRVPLGTGPDNIEIDERGDLWLGAHPASMQFLAHARDRSGKTKAPAQVLRVKLGGSEPIVDEVYLSGDGPFSAAASAAAHTGRLLIGPVFDAEFLNCRLP